MKKININRRVLKLIVRILMVGYSLIIAYPFIWTIYSSFKTSREFLLSPFNLPQSLQWVNYANAVVKANMGKYFINSVIVTILPTLACLFISFTTAYAITRFRNKYTKTVYSIYVASFMVPGMITLTPLFGIMRTLRLYDSTIGILLLYSQMFVSFSVFVLSGFLTSFSKEYEEAAFMDGCSRYGILFRIIAPISKAGIVTVSVFLVLGYWNEFIYANTFLVTDLKKTIPVGLNAIAIQQRYRTDWGALFAGMVLVLIPTLGFYLATQKHITSGLTAGGIKM